MAAALAASAASAGGAHTLYVSPSGSGANNDKSCASAAYSSIQSAVNASSAGGTVVVCPGTYDEQVAVTVSNLTDGPSGPVVPFAPVVPVGPRMPVPVGPVGPREPVVPFAPGGPVWLQFTATSFA